MLVGVGAQRDVPGAARHQVQDLHAVAARPDVLVAHHPHRQVGEQPPVRTHRQPGLARQLRLRLHTDAEDHHVRRIRPRLRHHLGDPAVAAREDLRHGRPVDRRDAETVHRVVDEPPHVRIERRHRLLAPVEDGHLEAPLEHRLGHLHADVPRAHHDRPPGPLAGPQCVQRVQERLPVVQGLHPVHPGRIHPRQRRAHRAGPGGDHQLVEARPVRLPALPVQRLHPLPGHVQLGDLGPHPQIDVPRPVLLGSAGDQIVPGLHITAHPVRDAAGGVRGEVAALEGDDLQRVRPLQPAGL
ncbi:hypothetical protein GA0115255_118303 [Streptomyces sp. Ncost-T6T-2b]|nr:hypothetical protein GA0115255_118303 [Streptomyces sp. Ncost-T6T-2b]